MSGQKLIAVICLLAFFSTTWANPTIESAEKETSAGNPKRAYVILAAKQKHMAGNPEFDYLLGVAALDIGKTNEAIKAFQRVLAVNPMQAGASLDLARAYCKIGKLDEAEGIFRELRERDPPEKASIEIERHLKKIEARRKSNPLK